MSQPNTTSQKPKPPSTAEKNLSRCMYLPRRIPSMSATATFTFVAPDSRISSSTEAWSCTSFDVSFMRLPPESSRSTAGTREKSLAPRAGARPQACDPTREGEGRALPGFAFEHVHRRTGGMAAHEAEARGFEEGAVFAFGAL